SSGGLYILDINKGVGKLQSVTSTSVDPYITALCRDHKNNLWYGTSQGRLVKINPNNSLTLINSYFSVHWSISSIISYKNYLIIGTNNGVSFFNTNTMLSEKSASLFGNSSTSKVNALAVLKDTLFIGIDVGIAKVLIADSVNLSDPSVWIIDTSGVKPVNSFVVSSNKVSPNSGKSVLFKNKILSSNQNLLISGNQVVLTLPSKITSLKVDGVRCWIGTELDYFYFWDGQNAIQLSIPGMTFTPVSKLLVDHNGYLWVLPRLSENGLWQIGIGVFRGDAWSVYSPVSLPLMGTFGGNTDHSALIESRHSKDGETEWRIWAGTSSGHVKQYKPEINVWSKYCNFVQHAGDGKFYHVTDCPSSPDWAKCDAIAQDSSGYIWMSIWKNPSFSTSYGAILCYDERYEPDPAQNNPEQAHYRRFFKPGEDGYDENYRCMIVDMYGNIIAGGGTDKGRITVITHKGNPLRNGVTVKLYKELDAKIYDMTTTSDGITRIVTSKGMFLYNGYTNDITPSDEEFGAGITVIKAEDQSVLWYAIPGEGLIRHDLSNGERTVFSSAQGLISTQIFDIALDKKNGYIWVGTDAGLSRLSIGYKVSEKNSKSTILAYPNPFIKSRHSQVYFKNIPSSGSVHIYTTDGRFLADAVLVRKGDQGAFFTWK
ncbi:MAG: hypothetical protein GX640_19310, partial [Fibrobacter sp.]|nr:hypothetical protein [Fibrobacter sp.]